MDQICDEFFLYKEVGNRDDDKREEIVEDCKEAVSKVIESHEL